MSAMLAECLFASLNAFRCLRHSIHVLANRLRMLIESPVALVLLIHASAAHVVARQLDLVKLGRPHLHYWLDWLNKRAHGLSFVFATLVGFCLLAPISHRQIWLPTAVLIDVLPDEHTIVLLNRFGAELLYYPGAGRRCSIQRIPT